MQTRRLSYDRMQAFLGKEDFPEESTNRAMLQGACAVLQVAIRRELTGRQQECVQLYFYHRLTMQEIGTQLGIAKSTVFRHLEKAKKKLRRVVTYSAMARSDFLPED